MDLDPNFFHSSPDPDYWFVQKVVLKKGKEIKGTGTTSWDFDFLLKCFGFSSFLENIFKLK